MNGEVVKRQREFLRRLFSLRNVAPIVIIIGAIIGALGLTPFGIKFTNEQIILALLAFLSIDSLVARLDLLANIEQGILSIQNILAPKTTADIFLRKRSNFPRMEQLVDEAVSEIWVTGVTLNTMVTLIGSFESKMKQGCNVRFLALTPDGEALQSVAKYFSDAPNDLSSRISSNLTIMATRLRSVGKGSVEIRTLDRVLTTGYFITDPSKVKGRMIVQWYLYKTDTSDAPLFELSKDEDSRWFNIFMKQFEEAWKEAKDWKDSKELNNKIGGVAAQSEPPNNSFNRSAS
jgi:hypothetical protein